MENVTYLGAGLSWILSSSCSSCSRDSLDSCGPCGSVRLGAMTRHTFVGFFNLWVTLCISSRSCAICSERMAPNLNNSVQAVITRFMMNRTRSQVTVALTLAKNRTYLTRSLHAGCEPKLLPLIHTYSNQTVNTSVVRVWNPMKI